MTKLTSPMYLHCRKCISEDATARIEVAVSGMKLEVWCRVHDIEISTFDLTVPVYFCEDLPEDER